MNKRQTLESSMRSSSTSRSSIRESVPHPRSVHIVRPPSTSDHESHNAPLPLSFVGRLPRHLWRSVNVKAEKKNSRKKAEPGTMSPVFSEQSDTSLDSSSSLHAAESNHGWRWTMNENDLKSIPDPEQSWFDNSSSVGQQTSILKIETGVVSLEVILDRIAAFMRLKSISCTFHSKTGRIDCVTSHHTHFVVQLWRGVSHNVIRNTSDCRTQRNSGDYCSIIIEFERRQGCAIEAVRIRQLLFEMIQSEQDAPTDTTIPTCSSTFGTRRIVCPLIKRMYREKKRLSQAQDRHEAALEISDVRESVNDPSRSWYCKEGMSTCLRLLESNCDDEQRLGVESLVFLTDDTSVCPDTARDVTLALLLEKNQCPLPVAIRDYFLNLFDMERLSELEFDPDIEMAEYEADHNFSVMHGLALQALANALKTMTSIRQENESGGDATRDIELRSTFWRTIIVALEFNLTQSESRPNEAALSAKCLVLMEDMCNKSVCPESFRAQSPIDQTTPGPKHASLIHDDLLPHLVRAHRFGQAHHLSLERESQNLIQRLGRSTRS